MTNHKTSVTITMDNNNKLNGHGNHLNNNNNNHKMNGKKQRKGSWDSKGRRSETPSSILSSDSDIRFTRKVSRQYRCGCCVLAAFITFLLVVSIGVYLGYTFLALEPGEDRVFRGSFRVSRGDSFSTPLANPNTPQFRERARSYRERLNVLFRRSPVRPGFVGTEVLALDGVEGEDLVVHFNLRFDARYGADVVVSDLLRIMHTVTINATAAPYLDGLQIDPTSLLFREEGDPVPGGTRGTTTPSTTTTTEPPPPRKCAPVELEYCRRLPYNVTSYPNVLGHKDIHELREDVIAFRELVDAECYRLAFEFVCQALQPECIAAPTRRPRPAGPAEDVMVPPCRAFCRDFMAGCGSRMPQRFRDALQCARFPDYSGPGSCADRPGGSGGGAGLDEQVTSTGLRRRAGLPRPRRRDGLRLLPARPGRHAPPRPALRPRTPVHPRPPAMRRQARLPWRRGREGLPVSGPAAGGPRPRAPPVAVPRRGLRRLQREGRDGQAVHREPQLHRARAEPGGDAQHHRHVAVLRALLPESGDGARAGGRGGHDPVRAHGGPHRVRDHLRARALPEARGALRGLLAARVRGAGPAVVRGGGGGLVAALGGPRRLAVARRALQGRRARLRRHAARRPVAAHHRLLLPGARRRGGRQVGGARRFRAAGLQVALATGARRRALTAALHLPRGGQHAGAGAAGRAVRALGRRAARVPGRPGLGLARRPAARRALHHPGLDPAAPGRRGARGRAAAAPRGARRRQGALRERHHHPRQHHLHGAGAAQRGLPGGGAGREPVGLPGCRSELDAGRREQLEGGLLQDAGRRAAARLRQGGHQPGVDPEDDAGGRRGRRTTMTTPERGRPPTD